MDDSSDFFQLSRNQFNNAGQRGTLDQIQELNQRNNGSDPFLNEDEDNDNQSDTCSSCSSSMQLDLIEEQNPNNNDANDLNYNEARQCRQRIRNNQNNNNSYTIDTSFINNFNSAIEEKNGLYQKNEKNVFGTVADDEAYFENPNPDFEDWDFHPNENDPPIQFTYITYLENLKQSLNTLLKKPSKQPLSSNSRKVVITAIKGECISIDNQDMGRTHQEVTDNLNKEYQRFLANKLVTKRKNQWLQQNQILPFYKQKIFKKLAKVYYNIDNDKTQAAKGQAFVLAQNLIRSQHIEKKEKKKQNINMFSPRKIGNSNKRSSKKRSHLIIKQNSSKLNVSSGIINSNMLQSPIQRSQIKNQSLGKSGINPNTTLSPDPRQINSSQKPICDVKIMQRRTSTSNDINGEIQSPHIFKKQNFSMAAERPPKLPMPPTTSVLNNNNINYVVQPSTQQSMHIRKLMHHNKHSKDKFEQQELTKQFPMIKFQKSNQIPHHLNHAQSALNKDVGSLVGTSCANGTFNDPNLYMNIKDTRTVDLVTNINNKNQVDKNNIYQQYYLRKVQEVQLSNKVSNLEKLGENLLMMNQKIGSERQSMQQSRLSTKDLKQDLNSGQNKTFYHPSTCNSTVASNTTDKAFYQSHDRQQQNQNIQDQTLQNHIQHPRQVKANVNSMSLPQIQSVNNNQSPLIFKVKKKMEIAKQKHFSIYENSGYCANVNSTRRNNLIQTIMKTNHSPPAGSLLKYQQQ